MSGYKKYTSSPPDEDFLEDFVDAFGRGQILVHICGEQKSEDIPNRPVYLGGYTMSDWVNMDEESGYDIWRKWCDSRLGLRDWDTLMELYNYVGTDPLKITIRDHLRIKNFIDVRVKPMGSIEFGAFYVSKDNEGWLKSHMDDLGKTEHQGLIEWYHVPRKIKEVLMTKIERGDAMRDIIKDLRINGRVYVLKKGFGAYWTGGHTTFTELLEAVRDSPPGDILKTLSKTNHTAFRREMIEELGAPPDMNIDMEIKSVIPGKFNIVILSPKI